MATNERDYALELQPIPSDADDPLRRAQLRYRETRCTPSVFDNSIFRTATYIAALIAGW